MAFLTAKLDAVVDLVRAVVNACFQRELTVTGFTGKARFAHLLTFGQIPAKFLKLAILGIDKLVDRLMKDPVGCARFDLQSTGDLFWRSTVYQLGDYIVTQILVLLQFTPL